ncbi:MAG: hypothetical protein HRU14_08105 [Planctomycetes bacterium]|nr:hypothetical protein [Planctomycetota bacterium]
MKRIHIGLVAILSLTACSGGGGGVAAGGTPDAGVGGPIEGLPAATLAAFERGRALMTHRFSPAEGLGPFYNATSCAACHEVPVTGGSSPLYRNFFFAAQGFPPFQGPVTTAPEIPSIVLPNFRAPPFTQPRPTIPPSSALFPVVTPQRNAPAMFGIGLFEFVNNDAITSNSDPDDANGDGISGRFNRTPTFDIGRFGYKCQANNIEAFIRGAANNQMGMTTDPIAGIAAVVSLSTRFLPQVGGGQSSPTTDGDGVPDPEISVNDFADIIAFSKFLKPPDRLPDTPESLAGEALFDAIGCTRCHLTSLPSSIGPLAAFTDLLIHDMGPALADGVSQGLPQPSLTSGTTENEFRTQPLWGLRLHAPFLHDGRADTIEQAILAHAGESETIRLAYEALTQVEKDNILAFLEIL